MATIVAINFFLKEKKAMKEAKFVKLNWVKGSAYLKQGVKGKYNPYNALAGGNGSFIMPEPAELNLFLKFEDGTCDTFNIIKFVRSVTGWKKLNDGRVDKIEAQLNGKTFFIEGERILNLEELLNEAKKKEKKKKKKK